MLCVLLLVILMRTILESCLRSGHWGVGEESEVGRGTEPRVLLITCPASFLFPLPWVLCASDKSYIPQKER